MARRSSSGSSSMACRDLVRDGQVPDLVLDVVAAPRPCRRASRASRSRRELEERTASTARPWAWASRNERSEPRSGSKRSGWFHRRRKTSWVTSSASAALLSTRLGQAEDGAAVAPVHLGQRHLAVAGDGGHQLGVADLLDRAASALLFGAARHRWMSRLSPIRASPLVRIVGVMRTTIDSYKARAGRLDLEGIDFDDFRDRPLPADALRSLRYMHDVEHHTVCYLRDLLLTPAHQDPEITSFLSCWVFEEMWHGEAIGRVLEAHGEVAGAPRIAALRHGRRRRRRRSPRSAPSARPRSPAGPSSHCRWPGAPSTSGRRRPATPGWPRAPDTRRCASLLRRIMKQEGGHIDFYASEATRRLADSPQGAAAHPLRPLALWRPVGSGVMPNHEVGFLVTYLFDGEKGATSRAHRPPRRPPARAERPPPAHTRRGARSRHVLTIRLELLTSATPHASELWSDHTPQ